MLYCAQRYRKFKTSLKLTAIAFMFRTHDPPELEESAVPLENYTFPFPKGEKLLGTILDGHTVRNLRFINNPG